MAPPAEFGPADEEPELGVDLPTEVALATDDAPVAHAEQRDDAADLGAEDLQDAGGGVSKAAAQEPGGATKCAYCNIEFESGDQLQVFNRRLSCLLR